HSAPRQRVELAHAQFRRHHTRQDAPACPRQTDPRQAGSSAIPAKTASLAWGDRPSLPFQIPMDRLENTALIEFLPRQPLGPCCHLLDLTFPGGGHGIKAKVAVAAIQCEIAVVRAGRWTVALQAWADPLPRLGMPD